jgi:hypothetical protein
MLSSSKPPGSWSTSTRVPLLSDIEDTANEEENSTSQAPWSSSSTLTLSPVFEKHGFTTESSSIGAPEEEKMLPKFERANLSQSRNSWESSASVPLLSDDEDISVCEEEKVPEPSKEEKKKSFSTAEYKIAFSHFVVRSDSSAFRSVLTDRTEDFLIFDLER